VSGFRVTERSIAATTLTGLQNNLARLAQTQQRISSGKQITRASDDPGGTVQAMQYRSDIATMRQYSRNADDGLGWLGTADSALTNIVEQTNRGRDLVLQGMSSGSYGSQDSRNALADELDNIKSAVIGLANTKYVDRPIFGGTTAGSTAYAPDGSYLGDGGQVVRTIGDNTKVRVDLDGGQVFGNGSAQLFNILTDLANGLRTDPSTLTGNLAKLDAATNNVQGSLASVGARINQIEQMRQSAGDRLLSLTGQLSEVEDIDLPKTITDLQLQQTAYQAALAATAKVVQPSLVDFLR
jgi:flagellar hook-associated protein 3 FlgL